MKKDKLDKATILRHLQSDLEQAKSAKNQINAKIIQWRNVYDAKPYGNEQDGRSQIVMPEARNTVDWFVPNALKPFITSDVQVNPVSGDDVVQADLVTKLINYQYTRKFNKVQFNRRSLKTMAIEGTVVARVGWEYKEEEDERESYQGVAPEFFAEIGKEMTAKGGKIEKFVQDEDDGTCSFDVVKHTVTANNPTADIIKNEDFYIDPQATTLENARFCIQTIDYSLSDLRLLDKKYDPDNGIYTGVDDIKVENEKDQSSLGAYRDTMNLADYSSKEIDLEDEARKRITIYEYYGDYDLDGDGIVEPIVATWAGNKILRLAPNPFPDKKPPYVACQYREDSFAFWGHSQVELAENMQKIQTAMMRSFIDMMATSANGLKYTRKGNLDSLNMRRLREAKIGDVIEFNNEMPQQSVPTQIPPSMIQFYQMLTGEMENATGITKYNQGLDANSLNKTATGINAIMSQAQMRMWEVVEVYSDNYIKQIIKKWISYNKAFLTDEVVMRIDGEDIRLSRDDIIGDYDLDVNVTMNGGNEQKQAQITQLLQVAAPMVQQGVITPDIVNKLIAKLFEVMDFKDIAKELNDRARDMGAGGATANPQPVGEQPTAPQGLNGFNGDASMGQINNQAVLGAGQGSPMEQYQNAGGGQPFQ